MDTEQKILLVAEFSGMKKGEDFFEDTEMLMEQHIYDVNCGNCFYENELLYNVSWGWIIPVIHKCEEMEISDSNNLLGDITHALLDFDIEKTFEAVVKFVEFYNQQKN